MSAATKPVSMMTEDELNAEAHFIAVRMLRGKSEPRDASMVMELSNRLLRFMPTKLPAADTIELPARKVTPLTGMLMLDLEASDAQAVPSFTKIAR